MNTRTVRALLMVAGLSLVLGLVPPAMGGGSFMSFSQEAYAAGQVVEGRMAFEPQVTGRGRLSDGPWFVFMRPESSSTLEPTVIREQAVRVDRLHLRRKADGRYVARVGFVLPQVDHGRYELLFCNDPCVQILRGYAFASFRVTDVTEASRLKATGRLAGSDELARLRKEVMHQVTSLQEDVQRLEAKLETIESRSDAGSNGSANMSSDGDTWRVAIPFGLTIIAVVMLLWRRRAADSWVQAEE